MINKGFHHGGLTIRNIGRTSRLKPTIIQLDCFSANDVLVKLGHHLGIAILGGADYPVRCCSN